MRQFLAATLRAIANTLDPHEPDLVIVVDMAACLQDARQALATIAQNN